MRIEDDEDDYDYDNDDNDDNDDDDDDGDDWGMSSQMNKSLFAHIEEAELWHRRGQSYGGQEDQASLHGGFRWRWRLLEGFYLDPD